jgi:N-acylneuraminate cytidylyltransferase
VAPLGGRPLLAWTIEPALASEVFDTVWVSSEDGEVRATAERFGARTLARSPRLAEDRATVIDVCEEALQELGRRGERFDAIYVLIPTTPFRTPSSLRAAWARFAASDADGLLSIVEMEHTPQYAYVEHDGWARPWLPDVADLPRFDLEPTYRHDGGHLIVRADVFRRTRRFVGDRTLAHRVPPEEAVDVNWPLDLAWAEFLLARRAAVRDG